MYKVLGAESCSGGDPPASSQSINPPSKNLPSKKAVSSFSESFISSGKQGGGAAVLGEGHDIVTREICFPTSFSERKQLRKSSHAAFYLLTLFCGQGHVRLSL
jgi:hypothetical protein